MKILFILLGAINFVLLTLFNMHMFQLNSYYFGTHTKWLKRNVKNILPKIAIVVISTAFMLCSSNVFKIFGNLIMAFSIFLNIPKKQSKIKLKFTKRVIRMFVTQTLLTILIIYISKNVLNVYVLVGLLNILSFVFNMISNVINMPIEKLGRKSYIKKAKKKLEQMPNLLVIGITGSYGKTSVKNFLYSALSTKYEVLATPKNYNTTLGVTKTILEDLKPTHQIFICEMGAVKVGDIKQICDIVNPKIGIITSIGPQHLESFESIENVLNTKLELADAVIKNNGTVFLNYNNEYLKNVKFEKGVDIKYYGVDKKDEVNFADNIKVSSAGVEFTTLDKEQNEVTFKTKVLGKHNVINLMGVIAVSNYLGIDIKRLVPEISKIKSVEHRLELKKNGNINIIDDSYNANPISSKSALDVLDEFEGYKIIVTPGLVELGKNSKMYNEKLGENIANVCDFCVVVGDEFADYIISGLKSKNYDDKKILRASSPKEALEKIMGLKLNGKITVLLENDLPDNYNV